MGYRELARRKLLEQIYDKMSDEEKRTFIQLTMLNKDHNEIMDALNAQRERVEHIAQKVDKQSWLTDFGSDLLANFTTDGLIYLGRKLFGK